MFLIEIKRDALCDDEEGIKQHICCEGTIDEDIMEALEHKEMTQNKLIDAVKARIGGGHERC